MTMARQYHRHSDTDHGIRKCCLGASLQVEVGPAGRRKGAEESNQVGHINTPLALAALRLPSLYYRRRRADMITVYKILTDKNRVDKGLFFPLATGPTRGHNFKIFKTRAVSELRRRSLSIRAVNDWNSLPASVVSAETNTAFKSRLDKHWESNQFELVPMP